MLTPQAWFITEHHYIHPSCRLNEGRYEFDEDFDELVPDFGLPPTTTPSTAFLPRPLGSIGAPNGWVINHTGEGGRPGREYYYRTYLGGPYDPNQFGQVHGGMLTDGRSLNPHDEPLFRWLWREERDEGVNNRPGTYLYPVRVHDIILTGIVSRLAAACLVGFLLLTCCIACCRRSWLWQIPPLGKSPSVGWDDHHVDGGCASYRLVKLSQLSNSLNSFVNILAYYRTRPSKLPVPRIHHRRRKLGG